MNALAGLMALVLVLAGSALVMKAPGAKPESLELTQIAEDMPAYIHADLDEWR